MHRVDQASKDPAAYRELRNTFRRMEFGPQDIGILLGRRRPDWDFRDCLRFIDAWVGLKQAYLTPPKDALRRCALAQRALLEFNETPVRKSFGAASDINMQTNFDVWFSNTCILIWQFLIPAPETD